jgi:hypothetical protein
MADAVGEYCVYAGIRGKHLENCTSRRVPLKHAANVFAKFFKHQSSWLLQHGILPTTAIKIFLSKRVKH